MSEDLHDKHLIDQSIAEALALGSIRIVGKTPNGDDQLQLTSKGTVRAVMMLLEGLVQKADDERRDFTAAEKREVLKHIKSIQAALK